MRRLMQTRESLITGPALEPVDLDEAKRSFRFQTTTEDTLIDAWISAARQDLEEETGRQLITATWEYWLETFPEEAAIELPRAPLQSVISVTVAGVEWDAANYEALAPTSDRGQLVRLAGSWPTVTAGPGAVRIRYVAGYGDAPGDVPEILRATICALVARSHRYRGDEDEMARSAFVTAVCRRWRLSALPQLAPLVVTG